MNGWLRAVVASAAVAATGVFAADAHATAGRPAQANHSQALSNDDRALALIGLGRVKRDAGDRDAARRRFDEARQLRPFSTAELAEYFWILAGHDAAAAMAAGKEVLARDPRLDAVRDRMITEAIALDDETSAVSLAIEGGNLQPATARWHRRQAESWLRQGERGLAADAYARASRAPDAEDADRIGLAVALESVGRHGQAVTAWRQVPDSVRANRLDWQRSYLRALGHAADAAVAATAFDDWLTQYPDDDELRDLAVARAARDGDHARAFALTSPPAISTSSTRWLRRRFDVARALNRPAEAIAAALGLERFRAITIDERILLSDLLIDAGRERDAITQLARLRAQMGKKEMCSGDLLRLADRLPEPAGTVTLREFVMDPQCQAAPAWLWRATERAVAAGHHVEALAIITRLPASEAERLDTRRLEGQLRLWTGDARGAAAVLEPVVAAKPDDHEACEALVDAYRAQGRSQEAWRAAARMVAPTTGTETLPPARLLAFAELALEASRPLDALALISRLPPTTGSDVARAIVRGRAESALGRVADARATLAAVPATALTPSGALALIDATLAMAGVEAALPVARQFTSPATGWQDVHVRRSVLESVAGDAAAGASLATDILARASDPREVGTIIAAEIALARQRPGDALDAIARVPPVDRSPRLRDLESVARAGHGDFTGALALLTELRTGQPDAVYLRLRAAEWRHQANPSADTLESLRAIAREFPESSDATLAMARGLVSVGRADEALAVLDPVDRADTLTIEGRVLAASALRQLGRLHDALQVLHDTPGSHQGAAALRAELLMASGDRADATRVLREAASGPTATPQTFLLWADTATAGNRRAVLRDGLDRFRGDIVLIRRLAAAELAEGDPVAAATLATRALDLGPDAGTGDADAWITLIDASARLSRSSLDAALNRFERAGAAPPQMVVGLAERLAGHMRAEDDPLVTRVTTWLDRLTPADDAGATTRDMAYARVLSAAGRWPEAIDRSASAVARDRGFGPALKLHAELLSWAGRHEEAIEAYTAYLFVAPEDLDARRQQARVSGWAGRHEDARRSYVALTALAPADARIAAEAAAKLAFLAGRWQEAEAAYTRWIAVEPGNAEAQFERAEVLRALGRIAEADAALTALTAAAGHQVAAAALARAQQQRGPAVAGLVEQRSAEGYGGTRLLDLQARGALAQVGFGGASSRTTVAGEAAGIRSVGDGLSRRGTRAGIGLTTHFGPRLAFDTRARVWMFESQNGIVDIDAMLRWRATDRWTISAGLAREPIFENFATLTAGLTATGGAVRAAFDAPRLSVDLRSSWQTLSDDNARGRVSGSISRVVSDRLRHLRVVAWFEAIHFAHASADYYTPVRHVRADVGAEYTIPFVGPRFRGDRQTALTVGYLAGTDLDAVAYHHPLIRFSADLTAGLALEARADWIRSSVYRETSATIGLTLRPGALRR
jgi:tetratricopeptide (TPR) repeat protein